MNEFVLELKGITKTFPGVKALDQVHFKLRPGEIHALMGENGAGKSTFIKMITGVYTPDEGEIVVHGNQVNFRNPKEAANLGIAAIYQHVTCYPDLTVTENIFMGHERLQRWTRKIKRKQMNLEAQKLLDELGADFDTTTVMGSLSVAQQQIVEIAKALSTKANIIIMDEPTAALTMRESEQLYRITEQLRDRGASIIFISHRFEDMYRLASKVTVFRDGKYIGTWGVKEISNNDLIVAMVGREVIQQFPKRKVEIGKEIFRIEQLSKVGFFADISFNVHKGEIVGLTGLVGAGRSELCQAIFGIHSYERGNIYIDGKEVFIDSPAQAMKLGIGYLPEDRQKQGLILDWSIGDNINLSALSKYSKNGWINKIKARSEAKQLAEKVNVKAVSIYDLASSLSGGNQQKVVVAKLLTSNVKLIILDEPTKGVDVGAKAAIYEIIGELAAQGYGIILVSSEMPEILGLSDRIAVMRSGRLTAIFNRAEVTQELILEAAMEQAEPSNPAGSLSSEGVVSL